MIKTATIIGFILLGLLITAIGVWGTLALTYLGAHNDILRYSLAAAFATTTLSTLIALGFHRWRWRIFAVYALLFTALLGWFYSTKPSNERNWQTDVAVLPYATINNDLVTVYNIRNFDYRSETDYTPAYYDKTFDLQKLEGVDVIAVYWMGPSVAHVMLSFAFEGGDHLAISIETRKEKGEEYSTLKGFFRQYELYYVVADERDVVRLRTNYRFNPPEDVYVYQTKGSIENGRRLFLAYIKQINALKNRPEFYNTLTTNCTTTIWFNSLINATHLPMSWKILVSGYLPDYLYENGRLQTHGLTFGELQQRALINTKAHAADTAADFSTRIREGQ
jgi:hypothetical protein